MPGFVPADPRNDPPDAVDEIVTATAMGSVADDQRPHYRFCEVLQGSTGFYEVRSRFSGSTAFCLRRSSSPNEPGRTQNETGRTQ